MSVQYASSLLNQRLPQIQHRHHRLEPPTRMIGDTTYHKLSASESRQVVNTMRLSKDTTRLSKDASTHLDSLHESLLTLYNESEALCENS